jgi:hypothetical protein
MRGGYFHEQEDGAVASIHTYADWRDLSRIDKQNERPLFAAFVAVIGVWATAVLLVLALV